MSSRRSSHSSAPKTDKNNHDSSGKRRSASHDAGYPVSLSSAPDIPTYRPSKSSSTSSDVKVTKKTLSIQKKEEPENFSLSMAALLNHAKQEIPKKATSKQKFEDRLLKDLASLRVTTPPPPLSLSDVKESIVTIYFEDPDFETSVDWKGQLFPRRCSSGNIMETKETIKLTYKCTTSDVIMKFLKKIYGSSWIKEQDEEKILRKFELFEAEAVVDDDDYNMGLFTSTVSSSATTSPVSAKSINSDSTMVIPTFSLSLPPISEYGETNVQEVKDGLSKRMSIRALDKKEIPLFVYHNWKFYNGKPIFNQKKSPEDHLRCQPRDLHFVIKKQGKQTNNLNYFSIPNLSRIEHYKALTMEKLNRRIQSLNMEEMRLLEETRARYERQRRWIRNLLNK